MHIQFRLTSQCKVLHGNPALWLFVNLLQSTSSCRCHGAVSKKYLRRVKLTIEGLEKALASKTSEAIEREQLLQKKPRRRTRAESPPINYQASVPGLFSSAIALGIAQLPVSKESELKAGRVSTVADICQKLKTHQHDANVIMNDVENSQEIEEDDQGRMHETSDPKEELQRLLESHIVRFCSLKSAGVLTENHTFENFFM